MDISPDLTSPNQFDEDDEQQHDDEGLTFDNEAMEHPMEFTQGSQGLQG